METETREPDIVRQSFGMAGAVAQFVEKARTFYYTVVLSGHPCPECGGSLEMIREGSCRCAACSRELDPTIAFESCEACGGRLELAVRRYRCSQCGSDVPSRFLFDGRVFDADYFRERMQEYRERKHEQRERVRQILAQSRLGYADVPPADLADAPGLLEGLNELLNGSNGIDWDQRPLDFDLNRYQSHVVAQTSALAVSFDAIPSLSENTRLDRIWRFIAIIFLANAGVVDVWQEGPTIMVKKRETDAERQGVPGDLDEADGIA